MPSILLNEEHLKMQHYIRSIASNTYGMNEEQTEQVSVLCCVQTQTVSFLLVTTEVGKITKCQRVE